jgi:hypothetical protein
LMYLLNPSDPEHCERHHFVPLVQYVVDSHPGACVYRLGSIVSVFLQALLFLPRHRTSRRATYRRFSSASCSV